MLAALIAGLVGIGVRDAPARIRPAARPRRAWIAAARDRLPRRQCHPAAADRAAGRPAGASPRTDRVRERLCDRPGPAFSRDGHTLAPVAAAAAVGRNDVWLLYPGDRAARRGVPACRAGRRQRRVRRRILRRRYRGSEPRRPCDGLLDPEWIAGFPQLRAAATRGSAGCRRCAGSPRAAPLTASPSRVAEWCSPPARTPTGPCRSPSA